MMSDNAPTTHTDTAESEPDPRRRRAPWPHVLRICVAAFLLWLLLFAPTLQHNAQVSPVGSRRTVALDILGPIAATSRGLQVSHIVSWVDEATGRTGNQPGHGVVSTLGPHGHHGGHTVKPPSPGGQPGGPPTTTGPSGTTPPTAPDITHPTAADPLRVLILGDSLGIDMGGPLQNDLANTGVVQATLDARESTGLTRPDYFNWPAELQADLATARPQIVVIMMGANDPQDFPGPPDIPFTSPMWNVMYADRVAEFMKLAQSGGATVIWVGMPPMQNSALSSKMSDVDAVDQQQAAKLTPAVDFISSWTLLGTTQGTYAPFITNGSGQVVNVRTPDGIHLTPAGGEVLSQTVLNYLRGPLHLNLP
jgi:lysophospholipase L1-like esterase